MSNQLQEGQFAKPYLISPPIHDPPAKTESCSLPKGNTYSACSAELLYLVAWHSPGRPGTPGVRGIAVPSGAPCGACTGRSPIPVREVLDETFAQEIPRRVVLQQRDQELFIVLAILRAEH